MMHLSKSVELYSTRVNLGESQEMQTATQNKLNVFRLYEMTSLKDLGREKGKGLTSLSQDMESIRFKAEGAAYKPCSGADEANSSGR